VPADELVERELVEARLTGDDADAAWQRLSLFGVAAVG